MDIVRDPEDIRTRYDITHIHEGRIASDILQLQPPLACAETTGLDALIVVIRRIYSFTMIGPGSLYISPGWLDRAEKHNRILRLSWHIIGDSPDQTSAFKKDRNKLAGQLVMLGFPDGGSSSFYDLCTSSLMNQTFWSHNAFSLRWPPLRIETMEIVDETFDEKAAANIVEFDRIANPNLNLQQAVDNKFGTPSGDSGIIYRPNRPLLVRVLYRTNGGPDDSGDRLEFNDLRQFSLPSWVHLEGLQFDKEGPSCIYTITAVVRMRSKDDVSGRDHVRTYAHNGPNIVAAYEDNNLMSSHWSVTDVAPEREYMLIYAPITHEQNSDLSHLPECALGSRFNVEAWKMLNQALDPLIAQGKIQRAQEAQEAQKAAHQTQDDGRGDENSGDLSGEKETPNSKKEQGTSATGNVGGIRSDHPQPSQESLFLRSKPVKSRKGRR